MACDPFQMALIHQAFRAQFDALPELISAVAANDTVRSKRVGAHLANMIDVLHHHHAAEDDVLWPRLLERAPLQEKDVRQAVNEHDGVSAAIDHVLSLRASWAASADPVLTKRLAARVDDLAGELGDHLDNEEQTIVPLIEQWIAADEWQAFIDRGGAYVKPANLQFALAFAGFVLDESTPDEQERFIASVPFAPRLLLKGLGGRAVTSYRTKVYGGISR